jgi:hypothetical protein
MGIVDIFRGLIEDVWSLGAVVAVVLSFVAGWFEIRRNGKSVNRVLSELESQLDTTLLRVGDRTPPAVVSRLFRGLCVERAPPAANLTTRWRVESDFWRVLEANAATDVGRGFFCAAARHLTALALVATFLLIGIVLARDVPEALGGGAGAPGAGNDSLRAAVQLIGSKFFISALGLLLSLVFQAIEGHAVAGASKRLRALHRENELRFVTREDLQTEAVIESFQILRTDLAPLGRLETHAQSLVTQVQAVPEHLTRLLSAFLKTQYERGLNSLKAALTEERTYLVESAADNSAAELKALEALRETIRKQAKSDLEALLAQVREVVSTGYEEESARLRTAMNALTDGIPKLDEQLRGVVTEVGSLLRGHVTAVAELQQALANEVSGSVGEVGTHLERARLSAESYGSVAEKMLDDVTALTRLHVEQLEVALVARAEASIGHLTQLGEKGVELAADTMSKKTETRFKAIEKRLLQDAQNFAKSLDECAARYRDSLLDPALRGLVSETEAARQNNVASSEALREATSALLATAGPVKEVAVEFVTLRPLLSEAATTMRQTGRDLAGATVRLSQLETKALEEQRKLIEEMIPRAAEGHRKAVERGTAEFRQQQVDLVDRLEKASQRLGDRLTKEIAKLAEVIDSYEDDDDDNNESGAGQPPPVRGT